MMPDYQAVWGLPLDCMARHECDSYIPMIIPLYPADTIYSHDYPIITG